MTTSSHDGLQTMLTVPLAAAEAGADLPALGAVCADVGAAARTKAARIVRLQVFMIISVPRNKRTRTTSDAKDFQGSCTRNRHEPTSHAEPVFSSLHVHA